MSAPAKDRGIGDLIAAAIDPSMTREAREAVYAAARDAVRRLQAAEGSAAGDPRFEMQSYLVEEAIRDLETDVARAAALARLDAARRAQEAG